MSGKKLSSFSTYEEPKTEPTLKCKNVTKTLFDTSRCYKFDSSVFFSFCKIIF